MERSAPQQWTRYVDDYSGQPYWVHSVSSRMTWRRPKKSPAQDVAVYSSDLLRDSIQARLDLAKRGPPFSADEVDFLGKSLLLLLPSRQAD